MVDSDKLRFDFSHFEAVTPQELTRIETLVNDEIRRNTSVDTELCNMDQAKEKGAMMLFGEKYGEEVRVLSMGDGFSVELCGGTHVQRTGDIGLFYITSESGIASGVRRIEAITGAKALAHMKSMKETMATVAKLLKANPANVLEKAEQLVTHSKEQEKTLAALQAKLANANSGDMVGNAKEINGIKVLAQRIEGANAKALRDMADALKTKLTNGVFLLASAEGDKVSLIAGVTGDLTQRYKAGDLMKEVAPLVGGKGGGRPDMAQGGGTDPNGIDAALQRVESWVQ